MCKLNLKYELPTVICNIVQNKSAFFRFQLISLSILQLSALPQTIQQSLHDPGK